MPPSAATPAAALEPWPACAVSPDLTDTLPRLSEESSLKIALGPATEELPLENAPGPVIETIIIQPDLPLPPQFVLSLPLA